MTENAPERIWAATFFQDVLRATAQKPIEDVVDICGYQEYIRKDLAKPTVKPLEWFEDSVDFFGRGGWRTQDYIGVYEVYENKNGLWTFDSGEFVSEHSTVEEAKAEGVKEHLRRILSALENNT